MAAVDADSYRVRIMLIVVVMQQDSEAFDLDAFRRPFSTGNFEESILSKALPYNPVVPPTIAPQKG